MLIFCYFIDYFDILFLELWLEWFRDEIFLVIDEKERKYVYDLFERVVKDYLCKYICIC